MTKQQTDAAEWDRLHKAEGAPLMVLKKENPKRWGELFAARYPANEPPPQEEIKTADPQVQALQRQYMELARSGRLEELRASDPALYEKLRAAWVSDPNPYRSADLVNMTDPKIVPARGPKNPPKFVNDGPPGAKYYTGGQPTTDKSNGEFTTSSLQWEYCRLEKGGGLDQVKKEDPKFYRKMLKAWNTWPNPYRHPGEKPVGR